MLSSEGHDQLEELLEQASSLRDLLAKEPVSKPPPKPKPKPKPKPRPSPRNGKHGWTLLRCQSNEAPEM